MDRRSALAALGSGILSLYRRLPHRSATPVQPLPMKLAGGFIEYQNSMMNFGEHWGDLSYPGHRPRWMAYPIDWPDVLQSMRDIDMDTVILKRLRVQQQPDPTRPPVTSDFYRETNGSDAGPTPQVLHEAQTRQMQVYVGLHEEDGFQLKHLDRTYLIGGGITDPGSVLGKNAAVARDVWRLYGAAPSFSGWYVPQELWNFADPSGDRASLLNEFFSTLTTFLRGGLAAATPHLQSKAARMRIATSPYFNREYPGHSSYPLSGPAEVRRTFGTILGGSGVDVLMIQDSLSVKGYDDDLFGAFADAARDAGVEWWANVENFDPAQRPASIHRFSEQICQVAAHGPAKLVTFDFYHYMNPVLPDCCPGPGGLPVPCGGTPAGVCTDRWDFPVVSAPLPLRKALYDDYRACT